MTWLRVSSTRSTRGAAHIGVDATGKKQKKNGGDGGVPEGEAAAGSLEHMNFLILAIARNFQNYSRSERANLLFAEKLVNRVESLAAYG